MNKKIIIAISSLTLSPFLAFGEKIVFIPIRSTAQTQCKSACKDIGQIWNGQHIVISAKKLFSCVCVEDKKAKDIARKFLFNPKDAFEFFGKNENVSTQSMEDAIYKFRNSGSSRAKEFNPEDWQMIVNAAALSVRETLASDSYKLLGGIKNNEDPEKAEKILQQKMWDTQETCNKKVRNSEWVPQHTKMYQYYQQYWAARKSLFDFQNLKRQLNRSKEPNDKFYIHENPNDIFQDPDKAREIFRRFSKSEENYSTIGELNYAYNSIDKPLLTTVEVASLKLAYMVLILDLSRPDAQEAARKLRHLLNININLDSISTDFVKLNDIVNKTIEKGYSLCREKKEQLLPSVNRVLDLLKERKRLEDLVR